MSNGDSKPTSAHGRVRSDPILLTGWPESEVDAVETVLSGFWPAVTSVDPESHDLNPFGARLRRFNFSTGMDELEQAVALNNHSTVVLCVPDIADFLAKTLGCEAPPDGREEHWLNLLSVSLRFQERNPERVVIVGAEDALRSPQQFAEAFSGYAGYQLSTAGDSHGVPDDRWRNLYQQLAVLRVAGDEELSRASDELLSKRLFAARRPAEPGAELLAIHHEVESLRQENGALIELAHRLQWQLEDKVLQSGRDSEQIAAIELQLRATRAGCEEIEADLAEQKETLQRIRSSTSWRLTKPLRSAISMIRSRNRNR